MTGGELTELSETDRKQAMDRFEVLRLYLEGDVPLVRAAAAAGMPLQTAQRWLHRYRSTDLVARSTLVIGAT